jgi:hypothetical protein
VLLLGLGLFCLALLDLGGVLGVGFALGLGALAVTGALLAGWLLARPVRYRRRIEVVTEDGRLWLPVARPVRAGVVAALTLLVGLGAVAVVGVAVDGWDAPVLQAVGRGRRPGPAILVPVLGLAGGLAVPVLVGVLRGTRGPRRTGFGPHDVIREGGSRIPALQVPWHDVRVAAASHRPPRVRIGRLSAGRPGRSPERLGPEPEHLDVLGAVHAADPAVVALLARHYRDHPEHREELGTPAAEERLRRGDLAPSRAV